MIINDHHGGCCCRRRCCHCTRIIVLIVSFLSLGLRTGIVVALSVPLVLSMSLVIMNSMGMNLDRITLGALILSLGLLVDDAIIAVEMMAVKMEQGWSRLDAA